MNSRKNQSQSSPNNDALAIRGADDAFNMAVLGESCVHELRVILRALVALSGLSGGHELIHDLAKVGANLADQHHNTLDCERAEMEEKLVALEGASHG